jgi:FlaA1/EpsC-like NDP-sugar epimerase
MRVLVTGAGGSIGSGICRQLITAKPAELVLLGHGENSIFRIQQELIRNYPESETRISSVIASTTSEERMEGILKEFKPDVVFHAAAHKHVPLMESNVCEAVYNNVVGTYVLTRACVRNGVKNVVHISTDKAADPSSVMGATKYLCECVVKAIAAEQADTGFVCVRFGNVLGSRGSVIPVFAAQIENGGPVTVTDPEMTRYFMTIPEAVRLVIQTGAIGRSGEVYLLDMGKPVKILDLAEDMIRLNGLEPHADIPIVFTGIRSGEKMHEQLVSVNEQIEPTGYDGLNRVNSASLYSWNEMTKLVFRMKAMSEGMNGKEILSAFEQYIPGYSAGAGAVFGRLLS